MFQRCYINITFELHWLGMLNEVNKCGRIKKEGKKNIIRGKRNYEREK